MGSNPATKILFSEPNIKKLPMTGLTTFYKQHCENLRTLQKAIEIVQRNLRECISLDESDQVFVYTKILSHLVNSWVEVRLMKLIYECGAFSDSEKTKIIASKKLESKWVTALNIAFCKSFGVSGPKKIRSQTIVPFTARSQYEALLLIIKNDLLDSNRIRNKIAHGQWRFAFNEEFTAINGELTKTLTQENILKLQFRLAMFKSLAQIINDLAVPKSTYQRDFDANFKIIEEQRRNAKTTDYEEYKQKMVAKKLKGLALKKKS